jgi:hypothetical protein
VSKKWREVFVTVDGHSIPIRPIEGLVLGVMEQRGFAFYEDGEVATLTAWLTYETEGRNTTYKGYAVYTFPDGATQMVRFDGGGDPIGKQKGTFTFTKGTGRFQNIEGGGTFAGEGFTPKADPYLDAQGQYTIPKR